jgi:hypothetical protein
MKSVRRAAVWCACLLVAGAALAQPPRQVAATAPAPRPVELVLEDQFERRADLASLRGHVVVLVFGDRKGTDTCRALGEQLHVCWHPAAKGMPAARAQSAPVVPLDGLKPGQPSPNVIVVPVACCGKVPPAVRAKIIKEVAKSSPDVVVWLDFHNTVKGMFGLAAGETNVAVIDAHGVARMKLNGVIDQPAMDNLVRSVQALRYEAAK